MRLAYIKKFHIKDLYIHYVATSNNIVLGSNEHMDLISRIHKFVNHDDLALLSKCESTLSALSRSADRFVRVHVAGNEHTPLLTLKNLSQDSEPLVRAHVACNTNITYALWRDLIDDDVELVKLFAKDNAKFTHEG